MASQLDVAKGREIVARWCNLAERRLEYLTELFETGRWRRFHSEQDFLDNIREAKAAVEAWRDLLSREASRDNRAIDLSWIAGRRTTLPQNQLRRRPAPLPPMMDAPIVPPQEIVSILAGGGDASSGTSSTEAPREHPFTAALEMSTFAARYPLLRNTL